ncbi:MAG: alpha/beta hydrolase [Chloroflexota bacterium]
MTRILATPDGSTLQLRDWTPDEPSWLHLLLIHGVGEHAGRYERTGRLLAEAGIAVTAYDHRGHGKSSGRRGDVERWADLTDDAGRMLAEVRAAAGARPVAVLAHSMGGLVAVDAVLAGTLAPDLLVLSAPGLGDALPRWQHLVAPVAAKVVPTFVVKNAWDGSVLSRDPDVAREAGTDPLNLGGTTVRLGAGGFAAQDRVRRAIEGLQRMPMPTLLLHGTDDRLVPATTSEALGRLPGVERRTYPGLRHELLNEPEGPAIVVEIVAWLRARVAARTPA